MATNKSALAQDDENTIDGIVVKTDADNGVVTLSSGMKVKMRKINQQLSQNTFTSLMKGAALTKEGQLKETDDAVENLKMLEKVDKYYSMLISFGVTMVGEIEDYVKNGVLEETWYDQLIWAGIDFGQIDITKESSKKFLAMRYYGFIAAEDWTVLSEKVLNLQQ